MKKVTNEVNPISPRANAKLVTVGNRKFLVGGMTAHKVTSDIYEIKIHHEDGEHKIEWKPHKFKNNIFTSRNSYAACGSNTHIYIWGGLETDAMEQKCLSDLIQIDIEKGEMRKLPLAEKISIHSSALMYDSDNNQLIAFGGTDATSSLEGLLYSLKLDQPEGSDYEWKKSRLDSEHHKGYLWQHTAHLSKKSFFTEKQGRFLTTIGGCRHPFSPFNSIVQFDLEQMKESNSICMKTGLVSHDSLIQDGKIMIFGGANGGGLNSEIITLEKGEIILKQGHHAVGCSCCSDEKCWAVIGGVCGPESMNSVIFYEK